MLSLNFILLLKGLICMQHSSVVVLTDLVLSSVHWRKLVI
jgi:hypothetical protein